MPESTYVIVPSLNPDEKLCRTVNELLDIGLSRIIIVDDGSDDQHIGNFPKSDDRITVLHHRVNRGKGAALKSAFKYILRNCADAEIIVTVDGDGQHKPEDVVACVRAVAENKNCAVLGCRDFSAKNVPKRSRFGNRCTSGIFRVLCGIKISDTQTGLRAFPVSMLPLLLSIKGNRFEYETNMLLKFKQNGIEFTEVPIETVYIDENKTSHFRPIRDSLRVYKFILSYFFSSIISFLLDISVFYIICRLLYSALGGWIETAATVIARTVSSIVNYNINRTKVFDSKQKVKKSIVKYYVLAIPQMLVSAGLVTLISHLLSATPELGTLIKIIVDVILFFVSYRIQQSWVFSDKHADKKITNRQKLTAKKIIGRSFLVLATALIMVIVTVFSACFMVCYGPSQSLRDMLVISAKQASATKWVPSLFMSEQTIQSIMDNSEKLNTDVIDAAAYIKETDSDEWDSSINGVKLEFISKPNFKAYITLVKDPERVKVGVSSSNFATATEGARIFDIAEKYNVIAAINGGEFSDPGGVGKGSAPIGLTYSFGKMVWNDGANRTFIGFDSNNQLICSESMTQKEADRLGIRDAVSFQNGNVIIQKTNDDIHLFYGDQNTGTAQRTAIGQRADGTVILLVTDGRTANSIGATRNDVIEIMSSYGAINAGMLDGGSSSMMYFRDYYNLYNLDTSQLDQYQKKGLVNRYKAFTNPRRIPTYFIVTGE